MRRILVLVLIILIAIPSYPQKKSERVKRKYRKVERIDTRLPEVFLWGKVINQDEELLQGVSVVLIGSKSGVHTNTEGEYLLTGLSSGRQRIQASLIGFKTKNTDIDLQDGINELYFTLNEEKVKIDPLISTSQEREQQILDIPSAVSVFNRNFINLLDITQAEQLARFVPGVDIRSQNSLHPTYTFRGVTSDNTNINMPPRIATFYNEMPINQLSGSAIELFDMERIEFLKGPQPTTFGSGAEMGVIHYLSKKPTDLEEGYMTVRYGNFGQKTIEGVINIPVIEETILARAAGFYNHRNGYVINSFGGSLNGINKMGGRFSLRFIPGIFTHFDLEIDYQKANEPGIAFMSQTLPNTFGETDVFGYRASVNGGDSLANQKEIFSTILNVRHYISEHTYFSSISTYRTNSAYELWDADGTAADALNFSKDIYIKQFTQELRLNFTRNSKLNGFVGASYRREKARQLNIFSTNEQHLFNLFFNPSNLVGSDGQPIVVTEFSSDSGYGIPTGTPLPIQHEESKYLESLNQSYGGFFDATYNATYRLRLIGGLRISYDRLKLSNANTFSGGVESVLGQITGYSPNVSYNPTDTFGIKNNSLSFTYRAGFNYKFGSGAAIYGNYSISRSPEILQFRNDGTSEVISPETINSFELGFKGIYKSRLWVDVAAYYYIYSNFHTTNITNTIGVVINPLTGYTGKATVYGIEATFKYAIIKPIELFGNYTWTKSKFDETGKDGNNQILAGNRFRLTPEHSFSVGLHLSAPIGQGTDLFATPTYSYKSNFFFDETNSENLKQEAYGVLNAQFGLNFTNPDITFLVYANNIQKEQYLDFAGNPGNSFGWPVVVPAPPRMVGTKLIWNFEMKKKPYYKRRRR